MPGPNFALPGKTSAAQQHEVAPAATQAMTPGKTTLVQQEHPTGNEGIDTGGQGACSTRGAGCFLSALQRTELNRQASSRLANASKNYGIAVTELKLEQMIKKVDELPWYLTLILGACGTALEGLAGMATKALKKPGAAVQALSTLGSEAVVSKNSLAEAVNVANTAAKVAAKDAVKEASKEVEKEMKTLTEAQVESAIKTSIDIGKEKASAGLTSVMSSDSAEVNEKAQALGYADILNGRADVMFEQINQDIGRVTDAIALAIWRSLDPSMHSAAMYKAKLGASLKRYSESNVSKMGREAGFDDKKHVEKEVRIAKLITPGAGMKYVYMDRVFDGWFRDVNMKHPGAIERSPAYDAGENQLSLEQEAGWKVDGKEKRGAEKPLAPDRLLNYVEPEFQELAIQKQKHIWLNEPEVFQMTYANGHPQVIKVAGS